MSHVGFAAAAAAATALRCAFTHLAQNANAFACAKSEMPSSLSLDDVSAAFFHYVIHAKKDQNATQKRMKERNGKKQRMKRV